MRGFIEWRELAERRERPATNARFDDQGRGLATRPEPKRDGARSQACPLWGPVREFVSPLIEHLQHPASWIHSRLAWEAIRDLRGKDVATDESYFRLPWNVPHQPLSMSLDIGF